MSPSTRQNVVGSVRLQKKPSHTNRFNNRHTRPHRTHKLHRGFIALFFVVLCRTIRLRSHAEVETSFTKKFEISNAEVRSVALICYGLPRSLHFTINSMRTNMISPLQSVGITVDIFVHTFHHRRPISNRRSLERDVKLDNNEWKLLQPVAVDVESVDSVLNDQKSLLSELKRYGDAWHDGFRSLERYLLALHSAKHATQLVQMRNKKYDGAILTRGDLLFLDPIDVDLFVKAVRQQSVVVPGWQSWSGLNDRFMYGAVDEIFRYAYRIDNVSSFCLRTGESFHSERFLRWFCASAVKQTMPRCTKQRAARVRADGHVQHENFTSDVQPF